MWQLKSRSICSFIRARSPRLPPLLLVIPILRMKSNSERPSISRRSLVLIASVHIHESSRRGRFPNGSLLSPPAMMTSLYGPF